MAEETRGRPEFKPNDDQRREVEILIAGKCTEDDIASRLSISIPTLRKYFRDEIDNGFSRRNTNAVIALYEKAVDEKNAAALRLWFARNEQTYRPPTLADEDRKPEPIGKKEAIALAASNPDETTTMGGLIAKRMAQETSH